MKFYTENAKSCIWFQRANYQVQNRGFDLAAVHKKKILGRRWVLIDHKFREAEIYYPRGFVFM